MDWIKMQQQFIGHSFLFTTFFCLLLLSETLEAKSSVGVSGSGSDEIKKTLQLLIDGDKEIQLNQRYKNVALVLGNTGAGKSTFVQWIAGDNDKLIAKETRKGNAEYIIEDNNRIGNATLTSKTIFPELIVDEKTNAAFYDCPGFSDTRGVSSDIAATYFIKKVTDHAESIKLIFVVGYPSVSKGVDRQDFMRLLKHSVDFIKNIDKYRKSIAIVATKVNNHYNRIGKNMFQLVSDDNVINTIADFLREVRKTLRNTLDTLHNSDDKRFYENAIKFVDILLIKDGEMYTRIGIFRRPDEAGPLSNITLLQEGKQTIEEILYHRLEFTSKSDIDFGYTISANSKNGVNDIVKVINDAVWSHIDKIAKKIREHYSNLIKQILNIIKSFSTPKTIDPNRPTFERFSHEFETGLNITTNLIEGIKNIQTDMLTEKITDSITALGISGCEEEIIHISNQGNQFNFLQVVCDTKLDTRSWDAIFMPIKTYLSDSKQIIQNEVGNTVEKINDQVISDIDDIAEEMKKHYQNKIESLEHHKLLDELNNGRSGLLKMILELKQQSFTALELSRKVENTILNMGLSLYKIQSSTDNIYNLGTYLHFLQVTNHDVLSWSLKWILPFEKTVKYLEESKIWHVFLNNLYDKLSEYEIQKDKHKYNVANIEEWGKIDKSQGIFIDKNNFNQFLNKIEQLKVEGDLAVKNITINEFRLKTLNQVLTTVFQSYDVSCQPEKTVVRGNFICINDFVTSTGKLRRFCEGDIKTLHIFALGKLFIDANIDAVGKRFKLIIIAPIWEITGNYVINLSGSDGIRHSSSKASNGWHLRENGHDGKSGEPGISAGSFFGIGGDFINGNNLKIMANGGNGSDGQDGGDGYVGRDGKNPSKSPDYYHKKYWCGKSLCESGDPNKISDFECQTEKKTVHPLIRRMMWRFQSPTWYIDIYGTSARKGGDGGNGGRPGIPGEAGDIKLVSLINYVTALISNKNGRYGRPGRGGLGLSGGKNGENVGMICLMNNINTGFRDVWYYGETTDNGYELSGTNGTDGTSGTQHSTPEPAATINNPAIIINDFKTYLRYHLNNIKTLPKMKHNLNQFLIKLESNDAIKSTYGTLELFNEMLSIEEQFHKLNKENLILFYQSLLDRINEYAKHRNSKEKSDEYKKTLGFLYTAVLSKLYDLKDDSSSVLIINVKQSLDLIINNIAALAKLQEKSNKINVINDFKQVYKENIDKKIVEAKNLIEDQLKPEIELINKQIDSQIDLLVDETKKLQEGAKKHRIELIQKRNDLQEILVLRRVFSVFKFMVEIASFLAPVSSGVRKLIGKSSSITDTFTIDYETSERIQFSIDVLNKIQTQTEIHEKTDQSEMVLEKTIKLIEAGLDIYDKHKNDQSNIQKIYDAITQVEKDIKHLKNYEKKIYNTVKPMLSKMKNDFEEVEIKLSTKSQIDLDVTKWKVQDNLKDMRIQMRQLTKDFKIEEDLARCIEKLDNVMTTIINIYDRIQNYQEQQNLSNYIADINSVTSSKINIKNQELNKAVNELEILIRSNLILKQHQIAVDALKQWVFPFAHNFLNKISLPLSLDLDRNSIDGLRRQAVTELESMQIKLAEYKTHVNHEDQFILNTRFDSEHVSTSPFYVWTNKNNKHMISKLLSGQEVVVKSDVRKSSPDKDAIKFNLIQINFKSTNSQIQSEMNTLLKGFSVNATHLGNSHYRIKDNFYSFISDTSQNIQYSFEQDSSGEPVHKNNVYVKIKEGDVMLSPYATWKIQLINRANIVHFDELSKYKDDVDLELVGRGSYVDNNIDISSFHVDDYYKIDNTVY